jgi:23S rRNA G2445 N2-methylase RlmL
MREDGGGVLVVSNPPWGMRIGNRDDDRYNRDDDRYNRDDDRYDDRDDRGAEYGDGNWDADPDAAKEAPAHVPDVEEAWQSLGTFFRRECGGATAHLLSGDANATRPLRMRARRKRVLGIGGVDCRLLEYRILPPKKEGPSLTELAQAAREEEKEESREEEQ